MVILKLSDETRDALRSWFDTTDRSVLTLAQFMDLPLAAVAGLSHALEHAEPGGGSDAADTGTAAGPTSLEARLTADFIGASREEKRDGETIAQAIGRLVHEHPEAHGRWLSSLGRGGPRAAASRPTAAAPARSRPTSAAAEPSGGSDWASRVESDFVGASKAYAEQHHTTSVRAAMSILSASYPAEHAAWLESQRPAPASK